LNSSILLLSTCILICIIIKVFSLYDTDDFDERYTTDSNQVKELGKEYDRLKDGV
jgi:hypothetical protein